MSLSKLVARFQDAPGAPILVDNIRNTIVDMGLIDEVQFLRAEMDDVKVKGFIRKFTFHSAPYAEPTRSANIYYAKNLNECWRRLVCAKELVHLVDRPGVAVSSAEALKSLLVGLTSSAEPVDLDERCQADIVAEITALPVLVPLPIRNQLLGPVKSCRMSSHDVAYYFRIPQKYVAFIMSPAFDMLVAKCMKG
jgi:hypothetical protein